MRAPRIKVRHRRAGLSLRKRTRNTSCIICKNKCFDELGFDCDRFTRSITKLMNEIQDVTIYETYRCMPLLGDEKLHAPDWEEHIVRYHIVFKQKSS